MVRSSVLSSRLNWTLFVLHNAHNFALRFQDRISRRVLQQRRRRQNKQCLSLPVRLNQSKWSKRMLYMKIGVRICILYATNFAIPTPPIGFRISDIKHLLICYLYPSPPLSFHHARAMPCNKMKKNIVLAMHLIIHSIAEENTLKCTSALRECELVIFMWQLTCFSHLCY